jgi:hypothetical protein
VEGGSEGREWREGGGRVWRVWREGVEGGCGGTTCEGQRVRHSERCERTMTRSCPVTHTATDTLRRPTPPTPLPAAAEAAWRPSLPPLSSRRRLPNLGFSNTDLLDLPNIGASNLGVSNLGFSNMDLCLVLSARPLFKYDLEGPLS